MPRRRTITSSKSRAAASRATKTSVPKTSLAVPKTRKAAIAKQKKLDTKAAKALHVAKMAVAATKAFDKKTGAITASAIKLHDHAKKHKLVSKGLKSAGFKKSAAIADVLGYGCVKRKRKKGSGARGSGARGSGLTGGALRGGKRGGALRGGALVGGLRVRKKVSFP